MSNDQKHFNWPDWLTKYILNNKDKWKKANFHFYGQNTYFAHPKTSDGISVRFNAINGELRGSDFSIEVYERSVLDQFPDPPDRIVVSNERPAIFSYGHDLTPDGMGATYEREVNGEFDISILEKFFAEDPA
mgnify:CR=1 FL=1